MNIAIIPARGGSVRIPRKNIKMFRGMPMLARAILIAKESQLFQLVAVSTDDEEIEQVALDWGAVVLRRPPDDGTRGTQEVAQEVLKQLFNAHFACVIYPCVPLLQPKDLMGLMIAQGKQQYAMTVGPDGKDAGAAYWGRADAFREGVPLEGHTNLYTLPAERCIDINTPEDWAIAEKLYDVLRRAP